MNQVTRRGTNWRSLVSNGEDKSIEFSDGPYNCIAVHKPGPPWRGGYVYMLHASICRTDTAIVRAEDISYASSAHCKFGNTIRWAICANPVNSRGRGRPDGTPILAANAEIPMDSWRACQPEFLQSSRDRTTRYPAAKFRIHRHVNERGCAALVARRVPVSPPRGELEKCYPLPCFAIKKNAGGNSVAHPPAANSRRSGYVVPALCDRFRAR